MQVVVVVFSLTVEETKAQRQNSPNPQSQQPKCRSYPSTAKSEPGRAPRSGEEDTGSQSCPQETSVGDPALASTGSSLTQRTSRGSELFPQICSEFSGKSSLAAT